MKKDVLVIGKGNVLLKDEGVGVHVIRIIQTNDHVINSEGIACFLSWTNTEAIEGGTSLLDFLEQIPNRKKVIIVDSVQTLDAPGTIYRITMKDLALFKPGNTVSAHHINLRDLLYLTTFLDIPLPEIIIIGINAGEIGPGEELSTEVKNKLPDIIKLIHRECIFSAHN